MELEITAAWLPLAPLRFFSSFVYRTKIVSDIALLAHLKMRRDGDGLSGIAQRIAVDLRDGYL